MQTRRFIRTLFALALAAPLAAHASLLGTRDGEWKDTATASGTGMGADGKPRTRMARECHKHTDSMDAYLKSLNQDNCKAKIVRQTARMVEVELTCTDPEGKGRMHGLMKMQALSDTHIVLEAEETYSSGEKMQVKSDSHWVSDTCTKQ